MKRTYLLPQLSLGLGAFCSAIAVQAGIPVWSFKPDSSFPPKAFVSPTGVVMVKYIVTNNSFRAHKLVISPQTGVNQNGGPCSLGPKGSASATCTLELSISGSAIPSSGLSGGPVLCQTDSDGTTPSPFMCYSPSPVDNLAIGIINGLTLVPIPIQQATANQAFVFNLKSAVKFYDENANAGFPAEGIVTPEEQDGLRFDKARFSILGTPQRMGDYSFKIGVQNAHSKAEPVDFIVHVNANGKDSPIFKQHHTIASALIGQKYSMNLMELIEPQPGFMHSNQIFFHIDKKSTSVDWLHIATDDATRLEGTVPPTTTGQALEVTLIASSNTGGDSQPLKVTIPIAYDPTKKPVIHLFELEQLAGANINADLSHHINDPAHDPNLKLTLVKVEPAVPWLSISSLNQTVLEGAVPDEATGQQFQLTLQANTSIGGSSEQVLIPLQISVDSERAPRFKSANPMMPMIYPGQSFFYDFVANNDIYPEYKDAPYEIKFANGFIPPCWLRLENNKLIAEEVPPDLQEDINISIEIKNIPGGSLGTIPLILAVMN